MVLKHFFIIVLPLIVGVGREPIPRVFALGRRAEALPEVARHVDALQGQPVGALCEHTDAIPRHAQVPQRHVLRPHDDTDARVAIRGLAGVRPL